MNIKAHADFAVANHGTYSMLYPRTETASEWVSRHIPEDHRIGEGYAVRPDKVPDILEGIVEEGLTVTI